jgi:uncharacterized protein YjiS (DUF1127 family)
LAKWLFFIGRKLILGYSNLINGHIEVSTMLSPMHRTAACRPASALAVTVRAAAAVRRWSHACTTWCARRQAIRALGALDDRTLKDFGINRSEIEAAVHGRAAEGSRRSPPQRV